MVLTIYSPFFGPILLLTEIFLRCTLWTTPQISAINDPTADNSLGNVVAANSIGVFLGLGWPWLIAASYWHLVDPSVGFQVPSSDLSFLVLAYTLCAFPALGKEFTLPCM